MSDDTLAEFIQHIHALLTKPATTADVVLTAASQVAYLVKQYHNKVHDSAQGRGTFDHPIETIPADYCLVGIGTLCKVKATICRRTEQTLYGGQKPVRLLALVGTNADVEFALGLFDMIDDTIYRATVALKQDHRHSTEKEWSEFGFTMASRINMGLKHLTMQHEQGKRITSLPTTTVTEQIRIKHAE